MQPDKEAVRSDATAAEQPADSLATSPATPPVAPESTTATADAGTSTPAAAEASVVSAPAASAGADSAAQPEPAPAVAVSGVEPARTPDAEPATISTDGGTANPSWRTWAPRLNATRMDEPAPAPKSPSSRFPLLAASIALAACVGAAAGGAGVAGISHLMAAPPPVKQAEATPAPAPRPDAEIKSLRDSVTQMRSQIRSLSESLNGLRSASEGTGKSAQAQLAKLTDTIERLEKAQAEPLARLTRLAASVERLERREAAAPSSEITGSVRTAAAAPAATASQPQEQRASRQVVEGWRLHQVQHGVALVEGRIGLAEVMIGDTLRGVGRIQDIRREDGRWVVVTPRGLIVSR